MEFIQTVVVGLGVFAFALWPLTKHFCIHWMDCPPEPSDRRIENVNPVTSATQAAGPGSQ